MPCGTKQPTKRCFGLAAVWASSVAAGTIASSKGSASVAPAPRRTVRREMCFLVRNMRPLSASRLLLGRNGCLRIHLECRTFHDAENDRREAILGRFRLFHD